MLIKNRVWVEVQKAFVSCEPNENKSRVNNKTRRPRADSINVRNLQLNGIFVFVSESNWIKSTNVLFLLSTFLCELWIEHWGTMRIIASSWIALSFNI